MLTYIFLSFVNICFFIFSGFRQFQANIANATATLRSRASIKSEDDLPPPYEAQISQDLAAAQQSPPPYHIAIEMTDETQDDHEHLDDNIPMSSGSHDEDLEDNDETDSKVNFAAKKVVRLSHSKGNK